MSAGKIQPSSSPLRLRFTKPATDDLAAIMLWTRDHFGNEAARRYAQLIQLASNEITREPHRIGVQSAYEGADQLMAYHIRFSTKRMPIDARVSKPRHHLIFKIVTGTVAVVRILHDSMDARTHLDLDTEE